MLLSYVTTGLVGCCAKIARIAPAKTPITQTVATSASRPSGPRSRAGSIHPTGSAEAATPPPAAPPDVPAAGRAAGGRLEHCRRRQLAGTTCTDSGRPGGKETERLQPHPHRPAAHQHLAGGPLRQLPGDVVVNDQPGPPAGAVDQPQRRLLRHGHRGDLRHGGTAHAEQVPAVPEDDLVALPGRRRRAAGRPSSGVPSARSARAAKTATVRRDEIASAPPVVGLRRLAYGRPRPGGADVPAADREAGTSIH